MFVIYDTYAEAMAADQHGHIKVYATKAAAKRKANSDNNSVSPKMDRYKVASAKIQPEVVWGKVNYS